MMTSVSNTPSRGKKNRSERSLKFGGVATIFAFFFIISLFSHTATGIYLLAAGSAAIVITLATLVRYGKREPDGFSPAMIILTALLLRALFIFDIPWLSDDIYRYFADGYNTLAGTNPYSKAPAQMAVNNESAMALINRVNHPHLVTIYPPAAQLVFATGVAAGSGITGIKLTLATLDLFTCLLIIRILSKLGKPRTYSIFYAWHPLSVMEVAGSGHVDAAGIFFLFLCLNLIIKKSGSPGPEPPSLEKNHTTFPDKITPLLSGMLFSLSFLTKLLPLIYMPGLLFAIKKKSEKALFLISFGIAVLLLTVLFMPHIINALATLSLYARTWEFSGFLFRSLKPLTGSGTMVRFTLSVFFILSAGWIYLQCYRQTKKKPTPIFPVIQSFYLVSIAYLLLTPTLHPWYALYLVSLLPFAPGPFGLALSWSVLLGYHVLINYHATGLWVENSHIPFLILAIPLSTLIFNQTRQKHASGRSLF